MCPESRATLVLLCSSVLRDPVMGVFVAVLLPDEIAEALGRVRASHPGVAKGELQWEPRTRLHVTLRYLGDIDDASALSATLSQVRAAPTHCAVGSCTARFGSSVMYAPVSGVDDLAARITEATARIGKPPERRRFQGHITLARCKGGAVLPPEEVDIYGDLSFVADSFALMQSEWAGDEVTYSLLETFPLRV